MALLRPHELMKVGGRTWSYKCRACPTPNHHRAHPFLRLAGLRSGTQGTGAGRARLPPTTTRLHVTTYPRAPPRATRESPLHGPSRGWARNTHTYTPVAPPWVPGFPGKTRVLCQRPLLPSHRGHPVPMVGLVMGERAHVETVVANGSTPAPHRGYRVSPVRRGVWRVDAGLAGSCIFRAGPRTPTGAHIPTPLRVVVGDRVWKMLRGQGHLETVRGELVEP